MNFQVTVILTNRVWPHDNGENAEKINIARP